jgi:exodeoxyribonuclease V beta subunit
MNPLAMHQLEAGALQPGVTVLEASAGTGKTYQITNLVVRLVAEHGLRMGQILVVTFTRAATAELRDRIRERLAQAAQALRSGASSDVFLQRLVDRAAAERRQWWLRVVQAQEAFDQALISTIHGFCQRVLQQHAFETGAEMGLELVSDDSEIIEQMVDDWLSAKVNVLPPQDYSHLVDRCGFNRGAVSAFARAVLRDPDMPLDPAPAEQPPLGWRQQLEDLRVAWAAGAAAMGQRFDQGLPGTKKSPGDPALRLWLKQQRTHTSKTVAAIGPVLEAWIAACLDAPEPVEAPADLWSFFDIVKLQGKLAPGVSYHPDLFEAAAHALPLGSQLADLRASNRSTRPWRELAAWVRTTYVQRLEQRRALCYQDLLRRLANALGNPQLVAAVQERFGAALIDEFQDTDHLQWQIFSTLFGGGAHHLYLIGDPKQAIYGFRGANVHVYADARGPDDPLTMVTNFRSDARYVAAMNAVMGRWSRSLFGHPRIPYVPVGAPARDPVDRLVPPALPAGDPWQHPGSAPLQIRFVGAGSDPAAPEPLGKSAANAGLPTLVACDVVAFLEAGFGVVTDPQQPPRPVSPGDIAVLVRANYQADAVIHALTQAGVPAVRGGGAPSVLESEEATQLLWWLRAVASPASDGSARAAAVCPLFGWTAQDLQALDQPGEQSTRWDRWLADLARWQQLVDQRGLRWAFAQAMDAWDVQARLLGLPDGERRLTNLEHLLELAHAAQLQQRLRLDGLVRWLVEQRQRPAGDEDPSELRLERDDAAVKVLTMHKSKGLQYPVVFAPFLWDGSLVRDSDWDTLVHPVPGAPTQRRLDVQRPPYPPSKHHNVSLAEQESWRENLRLLYVALTRARYRCVLYTGPIVGKQKAVTGLQRSPVGLLLHSAPPGQEPDPGLTRYDQAQQRIAGMGPAALRADLAQWEAVARWRGDDAPPGEPPLLAVSDALLPVDPVGWSAPQLPQPRALVARAWSRPSAPWTPHNWPLELQGLDRCWRRLSYSSITRARHQASGHTKRPRHGLEAVPDREVLGRDYDQHVDAAGGDPALAAQRQHLRRARLPIPDDQPPVPLAGFPAGAEPGTFLHAVFERLDFQAFPRDPSDAVRMAAGRAVLEPLVQQLGAVHGIRDPAALALVVEHLPAVLQTPLGGSLGDLRLADIPRARRLDELGFDLPIAGGDQHRRVQHGGGASYPHPVSGRDFGEAFLLASRSLGLRRGHLEDLAGAWSHQDFAGYLTGSIDLVFATPPGPGVSPQRFYVADYKSNKLDLLGEGPPRPQNYCQPWMLHEMEHHAYTVQLVLYTLALHRWLRQRLGSATYSYEQHVGGALYLFVRGMGGPDTAPTGEHPLGVFFHRPAQALIEHLDVLFESPGGDV